MYAKKEDALKDENVLDTQATNEDGIVTFKQLLPYYGAYFKESQTIENYQIRNKEKDIVSVYRDNGVRFLGEMTSKQLKPVESKDGQNLNTYLQSLTGAGKDFNSNTNWLVFNDNGIEKLVSKNPLKYGISWNSLYNAGLVFGQKEKPEGYTPREITMNGKKYIVRLIRAYNEKVDINNHPIWSWKDPFHLNATKGSEWNRLILPLIEDKIDNNRIEGGRRGSGDTNKKFVESNMPTLANYSWWTDFGGNNNISGEYDEGNDYGARRWAQEIGYDGPRYHAYRGSDYNVDGAGFATSTYSNYDNNYYG